MALYLKLHTQAHATIVTMGINQNLNTLIETKFTNKIYNMKYLKILLVLVIYFGITNNSYGQSVDSITAQRVNSLKQLLSLSDKQYGDVKNIYATMLNNKNDLQSLSLNTEERSIKSRTIYQDYSTALKNILTATQWNIYEIACAKTKQLVDQHLQQQKIKYNFLNKE